MSKLDLDCTVHTLQQIQSNCYLNLVSQNTEILIDMKMHYSLWDIILWNYFSSSTACVRFKDLAPRL